MKIGGDQKINEAHAELFSEYIRNECERVGMLDYYLSKTYLTDMERNLYKKFVNKECLNEINFMKTFLVSTEEHAPFNAWNPAFNVARMNDHFQASDLLHFILSKSLDHLIIML